MQTLPGSAAKTGGVNNLVTASELPALGLAVLFLWLNCSIPGSSVFKGVEAETQSFNLNANVGIWNKYMWGYI